MKLEVSTDSFPHGEELALVAGVRQGVENDLQRFLDLAATAVWTPVVALVGQQSAERAFGRVIAALGANGYARLARYDGRSRLSTFLALATREILGEELARDCASDPRRAWPRFARFFENDIRRRINRRFPRNDRASLEDEYQNLCIRLVENDYRRIRAFSGSGGFTGYILRIVERLLIDRLRQEAQGRPRLPAEIKRMGPLEQAVFVARVWTRLPPDPELIAATVPARIQPPPSVAQVSAALRQLGPAIAEALAGRARAGPTAASPDDEEAADVPAAGADIDIVLMDQEEEQQRDALVEKVRREATSLPAELRRYLQLVFDSTEPTPARELARLMGLAPTDVYKLRQQAERWLKQIASLP